MSGTKILTIYILTICIININIFVEGRRKKEEGRWEKEDGRRKREEGRGKMGE
ncbi:MAG: hypothetical protein SWX82_33670 [Cyanobacteriota bacterium]|nr:hypothetical protein [Cyanobacteriota bacterium]